MSIRRKRPTVRRRVAKRRPTEQPRSRPGGRSARIRAAVLQSALSLLTEKGREAFTFTEVAARAGVHETSIYRRWRTKDALVFDAALHFAKSALPVPNTGSLRSDLLTLVRGLLAIMASPQGQIVMALGFSQHPHVVAAKQDIWRSRRESLQPIFDRAVARGEFPTNASPALFLEALLAPAYLRRLVTAEPLEDWPYKELIDRLLAAYVS